MKSKPIVRLMFLIAFVVIAVQHLFLRDMTFTWILLALIPIPFIQNMFFTWVSRSRQGGDPDHHRYAAWGSNGVWAIAQAFVAANIYVPVMYLMSDDAPDEQYRILKMLLSILIYSIATTEGSVFMMKIRLGWIKLPKFLSFLEETGKKQVGKR